MGRLGWVEEVVAYLVCKREEVGGILRVRGVVLTEEGG